VFDLVVNMSGYPLPDEMETPERLWDVPDPVSLSYDDHCAVRDEIERRVMQLVLDLRREQGPPQLHGQGPGQVAP
jgi:hypothetical protein